MPAKSLRAFFNLRWWFHDWKRGLYWKFPGLHAQTPAAGSRHKPAEAHSLSQKSGVLSMLPIKALLPP